MFKSRCLMFFIFLLFQLSLWGQKMIKIESDNSYNIRPERYEQPFKKGSLSIEKIAKLSFGILMKFYYLFLKNREDLIRISQDF